MQPLIRRPSPAHSTHRRRDSISMMLKHGSGRHSEFFRNVLCLLGVVAAGVTGWGFAWWAGAWKVQEGDGNYPDKEMPIGAEILGYFSACLYLSARIPQIIKNHQKKSCEGSLVLHVDMCGVLIWTGLSLLFFLLSLLGNVTYGSSILLHSTDKDYVLNNLPWLMGSLGTMAEDIIVSPLPMEKGHRTDFRPPDLFPVPNLRRSCPCRGGYGGRRRMWVLRQR
jgi:hypothetical protein